MSISTIARFLRHLEWRTWIPSTGDFLQGLLSKLASLGEWRKPDHFMLYIRGANGTCLVRVMKAFQPDQLVCTILNDGTVLTISRASDAAFVADLQILFQKIGTISGTPLQVSGASELV